MTEASLSVLLIEDNASHAELVRSALSRANLTSFELSHVKCLAAASDRLATQRYDAILLDLGLPDALGLEALSQIHEQAPESAVIVLTGDIDPEMGIKTASSGADDYLFKGDLCVRTLERMLRCAIQRHRVLLQIRSANESLDRKNAELQKINRLLDRKNEELRAAKNLLDKKNKRLAQLYDMAQQFVDNVSHDFRTPLTVIKEYVSIMRDGLAGEVTEDLYKYLGIVNDRADDLAIMVDDMLDLSRLDIGMLSVWRRPSQIRNILGHLCPVLERRAAKKEIVLELSIDNDLPSVFCDPDKIGRVVTNLAMNAIKFCGNGGKVNLWARPADELSEIVVGVTDDGPGIAPENLKRIFERFHQGRGVSRMNTRGFGLGLSIAKELVNLNLGDIYVESEPGKGSTFFFTLPIWSLAELPGRYLDCLDRSTQQPCEVSLVAVTVESPTESMVSNAVDEFLQDAFRGTDLTLRILPHKWLILTDCPRDDVPKMLNHIQDIFAESNRNLPAAKLPEITLESRGSWSGQDRNSEVIRQCRAELEAAEHEPKGARILLVDDDQEFVHGVEIRLRNAGYEVLTAFDGRTALKAAVEHRPAVIVIDSYMPAMNGLDTLEQLGEHAETRDIPVVVFSASTRDRQESLKRGACFFLHKPFDIDTLIAALREAIAEPCRAGLD